MTNDAYEQARIIKNQIEHIDLILDEHHLSKFNYECAPPIRSTMWTLVGNQGITVDLNEGEIVCIREALKSQKAILERKFEKL